MDVEAAILCDAATIRDGLLHMLGGPISRMWRQSLPAPLGVAVAGIIVFEQEQADVPHEIELTVESDSDLLVRVMSAVQVGTPIAHLESGELLRAPFAFPLHGAGTDKYGKHLARVSVDKGDAVREIAFWVLHPEEQDLPPL